MGNTLYLTASEGKSGKSAIALGLMQLIRGRTRKPAFFRPIISSSDPAQPDHDINLICSYFDLNVPYRNTYACTLDEARDLINGGHFNLLMDKILRCFKELESQYDFVLCEGTDYLGKDAAFEFELNANIAATLGAPMALVFGGQGRSLPEQQIAVQSGLDAMREKGNQVLAAIVNQSSLSREDAAALKYRLNPSQCLSAREVNREDSGEQPLILVLPEEPALGKASMRDVCGWLNARVVHGAERLDNLVDDWLVAAMQVGNFLNYLQEGMLVITPGDREDILLASLTTRLSAAYPDLAGILLTGGIDLNPSVQRLIQGWPVLPLPVIEVETATLTTVRQLSELHGRIQPGDQRKIHLALGHFERHMDCPALGERMVNPSSRLTPRMFEFQIIEQARAKPTRIVLPEGEEERILRAAEIVLRRDIAEVILLGRADIVGMQISQLGLALERARIIQPELSPDFEAYAQKYFELRSHKGVSLDQARELMADPTYFGTMMVHLGQADGLVSGAINTTAHTVRPSLEFIKTKPGYSIVSSIFFMCLKDRVLTFGDCAINPDPSPEQLADIALNSAETARIFGLEPRVAMLSYSSGTSGSGVDVDKVAEAVRLAKLKSPFLPLTGPIQYDAAIDAETAKLKMPGDPVAGRATVFIFPDLNTGNNTYKAVQRAAGAIAIGPVLQGLRKPVNDLSRSASVEDIVNTIAITAVQAGAEQENPGDQPAG